MDEQARERIQKDLDHTYLVEAGAGTGKTTLLISRILRILSLGKATLPQIVAITFTEKAANELKNRLKISLEKALSEKKDSVIEKRFGQALLDLERAPISTIHGFCSGILREHALEAEIDFNFRVGNETLANMLAEKTWQSWITKAIQEKDEFLHELLRLGVTFDQMGQMATLLSLHHDLPREYFQAQEFALPTQAFHRFLSESIRDLAEQKDHCINKDDRGYQRILALQEEWKFIQDLPAKDFCRRILYGFKVKSEGNKKNWDKPDVLAQIKDKIALMKEEMEAFRQILRHNLTQRFIAWLGKFLVYAQEVKLQKNMLAFEDLLLFTRDLLQKNKEVRAALQRRYRYLLVDEFQDTDPLQAEILFFLAEKEPRANAVAEVLLEEGKLFVVGDPKQSIYRFRRADIEIYEQVKKNLGERALLGIEDNFRSVPTILDWINHVFSRLIQPPEIGAYQPAYRPLAPRCASFSERAGVYYLSVPDTKPSDEKRLLAADRMAQAAYASASMMDILVKEGWPIREKEGTRPIVYRDMAILLRRLSYVESFEKALNQRGIPYEILGSKSYYSRIEIRSLVFLLRAILEPYEEISVLAALRSSVFAVSDEEIFHYKHTYQTLDYRSVHPVENHLGEVLNLLRDLHHEVSRLSTPLFLQKVFERTGILLTFLHLPKGENRVANLLKVLDLAYHFAQLGIADLRSFVKWISNLEATGEEESESFVQAQGSDAVRIITIHRAKGLEFPAVFLGDLGGQKMHGSEILIPKTTKSLAVRLSGKMELKTENYDEEAALEQKKSEAEEIRLLYVAATRARDYLFLPMATKQYGNFQLLEPFMDAPQYAKLYSMPQVSLSSQGVSMAPRIPAVREQDMLEESAAAREDWKRHKDAVIAQASKSAFLPKDLTLANVPALEKLSRGESWAMAEDSVLRQVLASLDPEGLDLFSQHESELLCAWEESQGFLTAQEKKNLRQMIHHFLSSSLPMRIQKSKRYFRAASLSLLWEKRYLQGTIDLYFQEKQNLVLVGYITQPILAPMIMKEKTPHALILGAQALALEEISGLRVGEALLYYLLPNVLLPLSLTDSFREEVKQYLRGG